MTLDKTGELLLEAAAHGKGNDAKAALDAGANVNARNEYGFTPLHLAAANRHTDVVWLLIENGADIDAKNALGQTPLHYAATNDCVDIARMLIANAANIDAKNQWQQSPLSTARANYSTNVAELLDNVAKQQQGHAARVTKGREDKCPPQVGR